MSTDTQVLPTVPSRENREGYDTIVHHNSNTSRRRGLLRKFNALTGKYEPRNHATVQVVRVRGGSPLPHAEIPEILRSFRSVYEPHVGKKQLAKAKIRNHVAA